MIQILIIKYLKNKLSLNFILRLYVIFYYLYI